MTKHTQLMQLASEFFTRTGNTQAARSVKYATNSAEVKSYIVGQLGPEEARKVIAEIEMAVKVA